MLRTNARTLLLASALTALLLAACSGPTGRSPSGPPRVSGEPGRSSGDATATPLPPLSVTVTDVKYGLLSVRTAPGARCNAYLQISGGYYGDIPPGTLLEQSAGADGLISWTYPTPRIPAGTGTYTANCQTAASSDTKTGAFTIPTRPIAPASFTVRVTTDLPPHEPFDPDPSLVPLRDSSAAKMTATLAAEWRSATRGLGSLEVVDRSADITIFVVASKNTSHWVQGTDESEQIVVFVSGELGVRNVENNVAVALHELGHIWCCRGPDTSDGHWLTKQASPGLYGVDKYGLMTDPVTCVNFGSVLSCPNRFSDREMVALGFISFPAPAVEPCIQQGLALRSQIGTARGTLTSLDAQIRAIEAQYPGGAPPAVYSNYVSLVTQYNALNDQTNAKVRQLSALPCDSS
jgi:hypothetical protein